jgi:flagellar biosynthesis component FlhA
MNGKNIEDKKEILDTIKVVVILDPTLKHFEISDGNDGLAFNRYLLQYLNDIVLHLAIPAEISLIARLDEDNSRFNVNSYQVFINGRKCRIPISRYITMAQDITAVELAKSIARVFCQNRELCLTIPLSEKILEKWTSENEVSLTLSNEAFREFLFGLVRRGLNIDRIMELAEVFKEKEQKEWSTDRIIEGNIHNLDSIAIRVFLCKNDKKLDELFDFMQEGLFVELGIIFPKVSIDIDESLEENDFRIQLNDIRFPSVIGLEPDQFFVNDTSERLSLINITGKKAINPATGMECAIVQNKESALDICEKAGLTTWNPTGFIILSLAAEVRRNAGIFLTNEIVDYSLSLLGAAFPVLVDTASKRFDTVTLTQILRDMLDEEISIKDLRTILETLLSIKTSGQNKYISFFYNAPNSCPITENKKVDGDLDIVNYSNCLRISLRRYISHKYARGTNTLVVYLLDPQIESRIKSIDKQPLTDEECDRIIKAISDELKYLPATAQIPVILTSIEIRKRLRNLIEKEFPRLNVLSYHELMPNLNIQPVARISCK